MLTNLKIADIQVEPAAAARGARLDQGKIAEYAEAYSAGDAFPPPVVFQDPDGAVWLGDGLHRLRALSRIARVSADCDVRPGTRADAEWYAAGANVAHGLPLTREQRRLAVKLALQARPDASDRQIAEHCHCSPTTVGTLRGHAQLSNLDSSTRTGKDGKTRKLPQRKPVPVERVSPEFDETLYPVAEPGLGVLGHLEDAPAPSIWDGCETKVPPEVAIAATAAQDADDDHLSWDDMIPDDSAVTQSPPLSPSQQADLRLAANPVIGRGEKIRDATARQVVEAAEAGVLPTSDALLELERRIEWADITITDLRETIAGMAPDPENDDRDAELNAAQAEALDLRAKIRDLEEQLEGQRQAHERDVLATLRSRARALGESDRSSGATRTPDEVLVALHVDGVLQAYAEARGQVAPLDEHAAELGRRHKARRPHNRAESGIFLRDLAQIAGTGPLSLPPREIERLRGVYLAGRKG